MTLALIVIGVTLVGGILAILLLDTIVFIVNPERGKELFALHAMFVRSVLRSKRAAEHGEHRHHRRSDRVERGPHTHRRAIDVEETDRSLKLSHRAPRHTPQRRTLAMTIRDYIRPPSDPAPRHSAEDNEDAR